MQYCPVEGAITKDADTGAVVIHSELCGECCAECVQGCPYDIPKLQEEFDEETGEVTAVYARAFKCRLCVDRLHDTDLTDGQSLGLASGDQIPACSKTCPAGAISFGTVEEMIAKAHEGLARVWPAYPQANIYPGEGFGCMWILLESPDKLGLPVAASVADATGPGGNGSPDRRAALASLLKPFGVGALSAGAEKKG
jgi:formate dehydrogenase iron-sulfur subunit